MIAGCSSLGRQRSWSPRSGLPVSFIPPLLLMVAVAVYIGVFAPLTWKQHHNFGTFGFDMGIFDQGIWLLSRFKVPFVTVRGLHYFGNHVNLTTTILVPFYWLGAGPGFLSVLNTVALATGAVPLWLIGRDRLGEPWTPLCVSFAYLLLPSLQWVTWWQFHPDVLAVTPLLFGVWFAMRGRWKAYAAAIAFVLLTKEDAAMVVTALGLLVAVRYSRKAGMLTSTSGVVWFLLATRVIIPHFTNGLGPFYLSLYQSAGNGMWSIAWNAPSRIWDVAFKADRLTYYWKLFAPVALLPFFSLASLGVLSIALPHLLVNVVSIQSTTYDIRFQYSVLIDAVIMLAVIELLFQHGRRLLNRRFLALLLLGSALLTNILWSPLHKPEIWASSSSEKTAMREALQFIPKDAAVAASYDFVPQLTHRTDIYEFPNPWIVGNWGIRGENPPDPDVVSFLVLNMRPGVLVSKSRQLVTSLTASGGFRVVFEKDGVLVAERSRPRPPFLLSP